MTTPDPIEILEHAADCSCVTAGDLAGVPMPVDLETLGDAMYAIARAVLDCPLWQSRREEVAI